LKLDLGGVVKYRKMHPSEERARGPWSWWGGWERGSWWQGKESQEVDPKRNSEALDASEREGKTQEPTGEG